MKYNIYKICIISIISLFLSSCFDNKNERIIGYWHIESFDFGAELPSSFQDDYNDNIIYLKDSLYFNFQSNGTYKINYKGFKERGRWIIEKDEIQLFPRNSKGINKSLIIESLNDSLLVIFDYKNGIKNNITLKKRDELK